MFARQSIQVAWSTAFFCGVTVFQGAVGAEPEPSEACAQAMWWLPEDTETVVVMQEPFEASALKVTEFDSDKGLQALSMLAVAVLKDELLHEELAGARIRCAVHGARRFTSPRELGMMPYQGCDILQIEPASIESVTNWFARCRDMARRTLELGGTAVAVFSDKLQEDEWTFFACQPRPELLICATDQGYLEETLFRIKQKAEKRALPEDLPEWKHVDVKAPVWAVRHYRRDTAASDPSSPLREKAAANVPDPDAIGFVFWFDPNRDKVAHARYLSRAKNALALVDEGWNHPSQGLTPEITHAGENTVNISTSISHRDTGAMFLFVLLAHLGHGIYI